MPVRRPNKLNYEATDGVSWSSVVSNIPVMNKSIEEMIYEMNQILKHPESGL